MTDSPDWQTYANAQSDNIFASSSQVLAPGVHNGTVLPVLSWSSLIMIIDPTAGAGKVTITHFADAAATESVDSDTWPVNASTRLVVRTPLRAKYVRIDINVTSAGNMTVMNWANFLSASSDRISFPVSNQNLSDYAATLAASGTATYDSGEIAAGHALFYFKPYDATGSLKVVIHAIDELGAPGQLIADFGAPAATAQQLIVVPDVILQVEVVNTDAGASHQYDLSLTIPPQ